MCGNQGYIRKDEIAQLPQEMGKILQKDCLAYLETRYLSALSQEQCAKTWSFKIEKTKSMYDLLHAKDHK